MYGWTAAKTPRSAAVSESPAAKVLLVNLSSTAWRVRGCVSRSSHDPATSNERGTLSCWWSFQEPCSTWASHSRASLRCCSDAPRASLVFPAASESFSVISTSEVTSPSASWYRQEGCVSSLTSQEFRGAERTKRTDLFAFSHGQSLHVLSPVDVRDEGRGATCGRLAGERERVRSHGAEVDGSDSLCDSAQHATASN